MLIKLLKVLLLCGAIFIGINPYLNAKAIENESVLNPVNEIHPKEVDFYAMDYKAPEVKSIKLNKNIAEPGEVIKLSLEVVDDFSDIGTVQVSYQKPISKNSTSLFLEYNSDTGLYEAEILVDEAMEAGEWKINFIFVCDTQDNSEWIYNTNINPANEGRDLSQGNFTIKGTEGTSDYKAPEVKSIKLNKNIARPGEAIKLSLEVVDDFSDIGTVQVFYQKPISKNSKNLYLEYNSDTGLYEAEILVDEAMEAGEWKIDFIFVCDTQDNSEWIYNTNINPANEGRDLSQGNFIISSQHKLGWLQEGDKWYYLKEDGKFVTGWLQEGNTWYYLKSSGVMVTGWEKVNGTWYYFNASGKMQTGWLQERSTWYYLKPDGAMVTGWEKVNGTWYYFNASGKMQTGWLQEGNTWYYLKSSGAMATGWEKINGTWYYFYSSGRMATNTIIDGWKITSSGEAYKL